MPAAVKKLLASCDRRRLVGRRDFAILLLLSRLGLRAGEVAAIGLDDVERSALQLLAQGGPAERDLGAGDRDVERGGLQLVADVALPFVERTLEPGEPESLELAAHLDRGRRGVRAAGIREERHAGELAPRFAIAEQSLP